MKNTYEIDWINETVYIDATTTTKGEPRTITISLNKLELALKCTGSWTLYGKGKMYARGYIKNKQGKSLRIEMHRYLTD